MGKARNVLISLVSRWRACMNWEVALYCLLLVVAFVMRLWDVGTRAFHYDEVLHTYYSWSFAQGNGYAHDPMMHGPFQFHGNALIFLILGDSDFTARLLPAIFGTALVALPFFLRRQLGRWGSIAVASLLAFSPLFLYYSRYARNDIYSAFWSLLLVICMWRYFEEKKARYIYIGSAALSLSFCTKEVSY
ncbi:MAG: TIGR03663 family protein, partial [Dehalococcoidia bacterium]|nr:TIGR03663 family protein [Dehalococcoidia bacterium]